MLIKDNTRWNKPYSLGTTEIDGVRYPNTVWDDPAFMAAQGVTEMPDPQLPEGVTDENHYIHTLNEPPYLQWTPKSEEQLAQLSNTKIQSQIDSEEGKYPRAIREFMLGVLEAQFTPEQLAENRGYVNVKKLDDKVKALRQKIVIIPTTDPVVTP